MRLRMNDDQPVHTIYGKVVRPGEEFEINDQEGRGWLAYGWAKEITRASLQSGVVDGKANLPAPESEDSQRVEGPQSKRKRYSRNDMRAEDE